MGGNASLRLAMKHPHVFGAVYGLSACCMVWTDDFSLANPVWHQTLGIASAGDFRSTPFLGRAFLALASVWSPNPTRPPFYADFPVRKEGDELVQIAAVAARWSSEMPVALVDQYRENLRRLRGVALDVGRQDQFPHIVTGARMFDAALRRNGIEHAFEEYDGDHGNRVPERFATRALPFFSQRLELLGLEPATRRAAVAPPRRLEIHADQSRDAS
jgi:S-formylglutathione hydrolase FrmB